MRIPFQELDFALYDQQFQVLGGTIPQEMHALQVTDAVLQTYQDAAQSFPLLHDDGAQSYLRFGYCQRAKFVWISLRRLYGLCPPDRTTPMAYDDVEQVSEALNSIYLNIRGGLDNLAAVVIGEYGDDPAKALGKLKQHLFNHDCFGAPGLSALYDQIKAFNQWYLDLKGRRDPAAHRIPLSVAPAVLDEVAQCAYAAKNAEWRAQWRRAIACNGEDAELEFKKTHDLFDELQQIGSFEPLFHHHPDEVLTPIYPTVFEDAGQFVKVSQIILNHILHSTISRLVS